MFTTTLDPLWFPTCAVFDCDGVLLDSERAWGEIQAEILDKYQITPSTETADTLVGATAEDLARVITDLTAETSSQQHREDFYSEVLTEVKEAEFQILRNGVQPIPGALDTVARLAEVMPVGVASNSSRELLRQKLETFGFSDYLTTRISAEDVTSPKPAPDMYSRAIHLIGGTPAQTLTVEDTATGARAAQAAGTKTLILTEKKQNAPEGNGHFSSFDDPDFQEKLGAWIYRASHDAGADLG